MSELTRAQVKQRIKEVGYNQQKLADLCGSSISHINKVIAGTRKSQRVLNIISLLLGESISIREQKQHRKVKPIMINNLRSMEDTTQ